MGRRSRKKFLFYGKDGKWTIEKWKQKKKKEENGGGRHHRGIWTFYKTLLECRKLYWKRKEKKIAPNLKKKNQQIK